MRLDVQSHLAAAERSVSYAERDGQKASAVVVARSYATTPEDLWDALTNGERIPRWFLPISGDLQLGGRFQFEGNAGGEITACAPPSRLSVTWEFGPSTTWVEARVSADADGRARLALAHTAHLTEHWDQYGPGATGVGWEMGLLGLALHIDHPDQPKPDAATFHTTPDGRALLAGSSEAWGDAFIAAGADPDAARAAERRTTAFYTGEAAT